MIFDVDSLTSGWIFSHPFHTTGETFLLFLAETKVETYCYKKLPDV